MLLSSSVDCSRQRGRGDDSRPFEEATAHVEQPAIEGDQRRPTEAVFRRYNITTDADLGAAAERITGYVESLPTAAAKAPSSANKQLLSRRGEACGNHEVTAAGTPWPT